MRKPFETGIRCLPIALALLVIGGCATPFTQEGLRQTEPRIRFEDLARDPVAHRGRVVLVGGDIIAVENRSGESLLAVLQKSLDARHRPADEDVSQGRFLIRVAGFLDPAIYRHGRKVTVLGPVLGWEVRPLGEIQYTYPVIGRQEMQLWPLETGYPPGPQWHIGIGFGLGF